MAATLVLAAPGGRKGRRSERTGVDRTVVLAMSLVVRPLICGASRSLGLIAMSTAPARAAAQCSGADRAGALQFR